MFLLFDSSVTTILKTYQRQNPRGKHIKVSPLGSEAAGSSFTSLMFWFLPDFQE